MWIEVCLALMTPGRICFARLQCANYHNEVHTMLGPLSIPQYTKWSTPDFVKQGLCIIDYFTQRDLPEPDAFAYLNKLGVIVTEHGWTSEYSKKCSVCCVYYLFRCYALSFLSELDVTIRNKVIDAMVFEIVLARNITPTTNGPFSRKSADSELGRPRKQEEDPI